MKAFCSVYFDSGLLPFWLRYYHRHGVTHFIFVVHNCGKHVAKVAAAYYHTIIESPYEYMNGMIDTLELNCHVQHLVAAQEWYVMADLDEFHWCPTWTTSADTFQDLYGNYDSVHSLFYDRVASDGKIPLIQQNVSLDAQFPLGGDVMGGASTIAPTTCRRKVVMARGSVHIGAGHHTVHSGTHGPMLCRTHHFKWHGPHLESWLGFRNCSKQTPHHSESRDFLSHFRTHGKIAVPLQQAPQIGV